MNPINPTHQDNQNPTNPMIGDDWRVLGGSKISPVGSPQACRLRSECRMLEVHFWGWAKGCKPKNYWTFWYFLPFKDVLTSRANITKNYRFMYNFSNLNGSSCVLSVFFLFRYVSTIQFGPGISFGWACLPKGRTGRSERNLAEITEDFRLEKTTMHIEIPLRNS